MHPHFRSIRSSQIINPLVATIVGFGGTLAIVISAAQALGADAEQTTSSAIAVTLAMALGTLVLSFKTKLPMITAWSTPGAALIAATDGSLTMNEAVGCYLITAIAIILTAYVKPLTKAIEKIPTGIAAGMLAGVLIKFVIGAFDQAIEAPTLVLSLIAIFLIARAISASWAVIIVLAIGATLTFGLGENLATRLGIEQAVLPEELVLIAAPVLITPSFDLTAIVGMGLPLYLVTMASQNLPGFAVLKASGYTPPVRITLSVTGFISFITAPFGALSVNLAAITAAMCTGEDTHPDKDRRWVAGAFYGVYQFILAIFGALMVGLFASLPSALIATIAGLALVGALTGAITAAVSEAPHRAAAIITLCATASDLSLFGIGSAFWGLSFGLLALSAETVWRSRKKR